MGSLCLVLTYFPPSLKVYSRKQNVPHEIKSRTVVSLDNVSIYYLCALADKLWYELSVMLQSIQQAIISLQGRVVLLEPGSLFTKVYWYFETWTEVDLKICRLTILSFDKLTPSQNGCHLADIIIPILLKANHCTLIHVWLDGLVPNKRYVFTWTSFPS